MDDQTVQQTIVVTQNSINPNRTIEKKSFFNEAGEPVSVVNAIVEGYTEPTLLTGWNNFPDIGMDTPSRPRYFKDPTDIVWVDLYTDSDENYAYGVPGTPMFVFPEGYRPDKTIIRYCSWADLVHPAETTMVLIFANGNVLVPNPPVSADLFGTNPYLIGGFSFRAMA